MDENPIPPTETDRLRDLVEGRLAPADEQRLRAEIAADAALRAEFERFQEVHALTACAIPVSSAPRTTADELLLRVRPSRPFLRPWMAAAAVLLAAAVGVAANLAMHRPADVELATLFAGPPFPVFEQSLPAAPPVPAALAEFRPVKDGAPAWLESFDEARAIARASGRPMLLWIYHPKCPLCVVLTRDTFTDAAVQRDVEAFVPVRVNVEDMDEDSELGRRLADAGAWPYIAAIDADGRTLKELSGVWETADVKARLDLAVANAAKSARPSWEDVRAAAADVRLAESARDAGRLGDAYAAAQRAGLKLAGNADVPVAARAQSIVSELLARAQVALEEAAHSGADAARATLADAARQFARSDPGADLAAVSEAYEANGVFPRLHRREARR